MSGVLSLVGQQPLQQTDLSTNPTHNFIGKKLSLSLDQDSRFCRFFESSMKDFYQEFCFAFKRLERIDFLEKVRDGLWENFTQNNPSSGQSLSLFFSDALEKNFSNLKPIIKAYLEKPKEERRFSSIVQMVIPQVVAIEENELKIDVTEDTYPCLNGQIDFLKLLFGTPIFLPTDFKEDEIHWYRFGKAVASGLSLEDAAKFANSGENEAVLAPIHAPFYYGKNRQDLFSILSARNEKEQKEEEVRPNLVLTEVMEVFYDLFVQNNRNNNQATYMQGTLDASLEQIMSLFSIKSSSDEATENVKTYREDDGVLHTLERVLLHYRKNGFRVPFIEKGSFFCSTFIQLLVPQFVKINNPDREEDESLKLELNIENSSPICEPQRRLLAFLFGHPEFFKEEHFDKQGAPWYHFARGLAQGDTPIKALEKANAYK